MLILIKLNRFYRKFHTLYVNKKQHEKAEQEANRHIIPPTSKAVIDLMSRLRIKKNDQNDISRSACPAFEDKLYITFLEFLKYHKTWDRLPSANVIEDELGLSKRKRLEFLNRACEDGILIRPEKNGQKYKYSRQENDEKCLKD